MKVSLIGRTTAVLALGALTLTACGGGGTLTGAGASSQEAAMTAWTNGASENADVEVRYSPDGSGAGREAFLAGGADFAGSDAIMSDDEYESSQEICGPDGAFHVPAYISPIAVAFNLPGVDHVNMNAETIAKVFNGEITTWDDPEIAQQNPDADLPDTNITVVHRSDESGTTENFTEYLHAAAGDVWTDEASESWPVSGQENAQGTSGVVSTVSGTEGAITYADASAVEEGGDLGTVSVGVGGEYVDLSAEAAATAVEASTVIEGRSDAEMAMELARDTEESGAYPIVLVSYHIYCNEYQDQDTADAAKAFGLYVVSEDGQNTAADAAGSAPLSESLRSQAEESINGITAAE
ncbi:MULTISPECIES: phosphate ABC transporter substrate-binding protein PstS [Kocuria]|uniref:Phosphate-binding protein n=1 Tax=Kocuria subflava TaxID=1736139 RepID=A0A846U9Z6_9MICC|nr:phosphate ABC transporter substrate-binding protein PstS [Kocuria sp. CPCC 104605]NKE10356.1 phosphate ABC transporter substrate-binding protein PstS [Kocuria subflava]